MERWQKFSDRQGDDARSRSIRAEGLYRIGKLTSDLVADKGPQAEIAKALELQKQLVLEFPDNANYQKQLAEIYLAFRDRTGEFPKRAKARSHRKSSFWIALLPYSARLSTPDTKISHTSRKIRTSIQFEIERISRIT